MKVELELDAETLMALRGRARVHGLVAHRDGVRDDDLLPWVIDVDAQHFGRELRKILAAQVGVGIAGAVARRVEGSGRRSLGVDLRPASRRAEPVAEQRSRPD